MYYLENTREFWSQLSSAEDTPSRLVLRAPWKTCLSQTFGHSFNELCKIHFVLAEYLGSAARLYSALVLGEPDIGKLEQARSTFIDFLDGCHGAGMVSKIISTFPELEDIAELSELMNAAAAKPLSEALMEFQTSINMLQKNCNCRACQPRGPKTNGATTCLHGIAYCILQMARSLACVEYDRNLLPTTAGIRWMHSNAPPVPKLKEMSREVLYDLLCLHEGTRDQIFQDPVYIFSGRYLRLTSLDDDARASPLVGGASLCAASSQGICYYIDGLRQLSSSPTFLRVLHITPGHIQFNNRRYEGVVDLHLPLWDLMNDSSSAHIFTHYNTIDKDLAQELQKELKPKVSERAGTKALGFGYQISLPLTGPDTFGGTMPPLILPPGLITRTVLKETGLISCSRSPDLCPQEQTLPMQILPEYKRVAVATEDCGLDFAGHKAACVYFHPERDDLDHCIAVVLQMLKRDNHQLLVRRGECLNCCSRAAFKGLRPPEAFGGREGVVQIIDPECDDGSATKMRTIHQIF